MVVRLSLVGEGLGGVTLGAWSAFESRRNAAQDYLGAVLNGGDLSKFRSFDESAVD